MASTGAEVTASLRATNAAEASADHEKPSFLRRAVRGAAMVSSGDDVAEVRD